MRTLKICLPQKHIQFRCYASMTLHQTPENVATRTALLADIARGRSIPATIVTRPPTTNFFKTDPTAAQHFASTGDDIIFEELEYLAEEASANASSKDQIWVPLRIAKPNNKTSQPTRLPTVILLHATGVDINSLAQRQAAFARRGYLAAAIDCRYHGARAVQGVTMWDGYQESLVRAWREGPERPFLLDNIWDSQRLLDYLTSEQRDDVDVERIGVTGVSLGGMHSWLLAAADDRISAGAPMIGVQNFSWAVQHNKYHARVESIPLVFAAAAADLHQNKHHQAHAIDAYVVETVWRKLLPGLLNSYDAPYSLPSIAPRPLIIVNGELDPRCPIAGLEVAIKSAKAVYDRCEAGDKLQWYVEKGTGHQCTESMWRVTESFLDECLLA